MTYLRYVLMTFYFLVISSGAHAQIATLDGNWHSPQWKYGYVLKDGMGIATSTNSPNFQVGQNIIQLTATSPNTFTGQQVYTDGKFYKVTVTLLADGRLSFVGEKNVKWVMERIGAPPQASSSASQTTAPALNQGQPSASASAGVGAQSQASPEIDTTFTLVNSSAEPIFEFFISPIKSTGWDKDILGEAVLMPGFEQAFTAGNSRGCQFDLRVVYGNKGFEEKRNLNLCQLERIVFDGRASTASTAQANPASAPRPTPSNVSPAPPLASPKQPAQRYASMDQFIAPEICAKYADNPIAAEKQFKGKLIKIYGPIERIAVDAFGTPFILISGRPVPCSVRLNFPKNKVSTLEDLRRGEFITAVCKTTNKILTNIMTDECQLL